MMELTQVLVSAVNSYVSSSESNSAVTICVKQLEAGHVKLVDLVSVLSSALTSDVVAERRRGIQLLIDAITALPDTFFLDTEILLLMEFFCARLSDHHAVVPLCLAGIMKLLQLRTLGSADIIRVVRVIFSDVTVQTLVQSDRMLVYKMFNWLLIDRLSDLRGITAEFVCGFVQAIDCEKDPRNLLICLRLVETVAKEFTLNATLAEQLFEVVACYYPIDFSPPAGLTTSVTRDQLSAALLNAMTVNPLFGRFCLPLLLEKLSSNVVSAKIDSLLLLVQCCNRFDQKDIGEHSVELWNCIKSDVFAQNLVIEDEALRVLSALVRCMSDGVDSNNSKPSPCDKFVLVIFEDCGKYLYNAGEVVCKQAGKLLSATCNGSAAACCLMVQLAMPVIVCEFHRHTESLPRQTLLDVLHGLLVAASTVSVNSSQSPMAAYKESVTDVFVSLLSNSEPALRCRAVNGVASLAVMPCLLDAGERHLLMQQLLNVLLSDLDSTVVQESIASATLIASKQPAAVCHIFLPVLTPILKATKEDIEFGQHIDTLFIVHLLSSISVHSVVTMETTPLLFSHISSLTQNDDCCLEVFHQCCVCLMSVVTMMSCDCGEYFVDWLAPKCVALTLHICTASQRTAHAHQVVAELAHIVSTIVQCCSAADTSLKQFVSSLLETFLHGSVVKYHEHVDLIIVDLIPLSANFCGEQVCSLAVLTAVVCSLSYDCIVSSLVDELMSRLMDIILQCADDVVYVCACKCLTGLINRRSSDTFLDTALQSVQSAVLAEICAKDSGKLSSKLTALTLCIWTTKALVMRNHIEQSVFLKFLIDALGDSELSSAAADGFKLVLSDDSELTDGIFSCAAGATRTLMYKQRFFTMSLPLLLADYADCEMKQPYVMALSHLMQFVPQQVLVPEIPRLMPVLLQSLSSEEPSVWLTTLHTLTELIVVNSEIIRSYTDDLLPKVLCLSAYRPMMKVRIAAIRFIAECSVMPVHLILPHQQKVLQQLGLTIDDHKRLVRQESATARSRWFLIGLCDN